MLSVGLESERSGDGASVGGGLKCIGRYVILSFTTNDLLKGAKGEVGSSADSSKGANEISMAGTPALSSVIEMISIMLDAMGDYKGLF